MSTPEDRKPTENAQKSNEESTSFNDGTIRCDVRFKFINHMKDATFFDEIPFYNYETGKFMKRSRSS